jgi:carbon-monoxide dehydrogenase large subunit
MDQTIAKTWVGRSIRRVEDPALVRGEGRFTADLPSPNWVRFVRSPAASGRILGITAPAGTRIFSAADLVGVKPVRPMLSKFNYQPITQPVLADGVVRYMGELVAAIVAESEERAEDLAEQTVVDIEPTEPVVRAHAALAPDAPIVHAGMANNIVVSVDTATPGHRAAMDAAHLTLSRHVVSGRQNGTPIEARAAHAAYDPASGRVTLTCTSQTPHMMRTIIADLLGMAESDLRVIAPDVGGGFGQKMSLAPEFVVLVWIARKLRRTVAWTEDRRENLMASFHSRDMEITVTGAFDACARLMALTGDVLANVGAYAPYPNTAGVEPLMSYTELPGPYRVMEYACRARGVTTNTCPTGPYRGVARPVLTLAMERLMDEAAREFGIEPAEIRRRNLVDQFPHVTPTGLVYDQATYVQTMELALSAADVPAFRARQRAALAEGRYLGLGLATFCERTGYGSPAFAARGMAVTPGWERVQVSMDPSGFVEARIGASPHGQGLRTTLAQIIADETGVSPDRVRIIHGDTDRTPYGWGTFASRSMVISGGATMLASRRLGETLRAVAATMLEAAAADVVLADNDARIIGTDRMLPICEIARAAYHQSHRFETAPGLEESATYDPAGTFSNACHIALVEVDIALCAVRVERFIVAEDAGRLINPMIVDGQIHGGVAQGIANALLEEIIYDDTGNILTTTLVDYLPPTLREIPPIEIHHLESITDQSVTGAKGLGEGGTVGAPAAVLNAINDALRPLGAELNTMPATPLRIHAALQVGQTLLPPPSGIHCGEGRGGG